VGTPAQEAVHALANAAGGVDPGGSMSVAPLETRRLHEPLGRRLPRRPRPRASVSISRPRLLTMLGGDDPAPFVLLVAPAGYGKTTLLSQWCARDPRPCAWITLDRRHEDQWFLLGTIARAVDSAAGPEEPMLLVLDDVNALQSAPARETLASLALEPPDGMQIAFASRAELPLPVARMRAQNLVTELGAAELAMTRAEAAGLCRAAGLRLETAELDTLVRRTEGWPAGLSLAARSLREHVVPGPRLARFDGADRLVADYLRAEILAERSPEELEFALQTSVLDVLTAPLCDAVLERSDSAWMLARLTRANFPLVALDSSGERRRHHRLVAGMLRAELRRTESELFRTLHARASRWHAQAGDRERALQHALAAGEIARGATLLWAEVGNAAERGTSAELEHWLERFSSDEVAADPRLALAAAGSHLARGRGHVAEHWLRAAAGGGDAVAGVVAALRAALARDGIAQMASDAERASALLAPDSRCQSLCRLVSGAADHLRGRREAARRALEDGARRAAVAAPQIQALCLAQLSLLALDENDWEGASQLITRARAQVARQGSNRYPAGALVLAVSGLVRSQRGRSEDAVADLRAAAALRERLVDYTAWYELELDITLARAALRLSDANEARARLAAAARLITRVPEAAVLYDWLRVAQADLAGYVAAVGNASASLTPAELRVVRLLPTHLTYREIAERTHVSPNTVKTQAYAAYRKLLVGSRSEAVERARELGLIA
jgi:LuxR family maltose regulon positive regulatory protein